MQVTADETFTAVHQCQMLTFEKDTVIGGDIAAYLIRTGAAVTPADDDARDVAEGKAVPVAVPEPEPEPEPPAELDITGKIHEVLAWVGGDQERALIAHAAEEVRGDQARSTLLAKLADIGLD